MPGSFQLTCFKVYPHGPTYQHFIPFLQLSNIPLGRHHTFPFFLFLSLGSLWGSCSGHFTSTPGTGTPSPGCLDASCLGCTTWHVRSQFHHQGPDQCSLHWKHAVLTTGLPGKSVDLSFPSVHTPSMFSTLHKQFCLLNLLKN